VKLYLDGKEHEVPRWLFEYLGLCKVYYDMYRDYETEIEEIVESLPKHLKKLIKEVQ